MGKVVERISKVTYVCDVPGCGEKAVARVGLRILPLDPKAARTIRPRLVYACEFHVNDLIGTYGPFENKAG